MSYPRLPGRRPARIAAAAALLALAAFAPHVVPSAAALTARGAVAGFSDYPDPSGVWYAGGCQDAQWTFGLSETGAAVDAVNDESVGEVDINATAATGCASIFAVETGTVSLSASTAAGVGDLDCPAMSGTYTRTLLLWSVTVSGDCTLNGKPEPGEQLTISVIGAPVSIGGDFGNFNGFALSGTVTWS